MKYKILAVICFLVAISSSAFAAASKIPDVLTFKLSNSVSANYTVTSATAAEAQGYAAATKHMSGDKAYASANDTSNIYFIGATIGKDIDGATLANSAALPTAGLLTSSAWKSQ
ncbi:MAG: hypothetical protein HIU83_09005 [Proteobacteria bacterium]|nr:hypothetical protein [Pseudomonadota bacterium]